MLLHCMLQAAVFVGVIGVSITLIIAAIAGLSRLIEYVDDRHDGWGPIVALMIILVGGFIAFTTLCYFGGDK